MMMLHLLLSFTAPFVCPYAGNHEDPCDCTRFYMCAVGATTPIITYCNGAPSVVYDSRLGICVWDFQAAPDECDQVR